MSDERDVVMPPGPGIGSLGPPEPVPERTPENMICLRGPCRHYWHMVAMADAGNPAGTWAKLGVDAPRQHHHTCLAGPEETDLAEDNVFECNRWEPYTNDELIKIKARRDQYTRRTKGAK